MNIAEYEDSISKEVEKLSKEDLAKLKEFTKQLKEYLNNGKPNSYADLQSYFYTLEGDQFNTIKEILINRFATIRQENKNIG